MRCRICDKNVKVTNSKVRSKGYKECKECMYIIGEIKPGVIWYV